MLTKVIFRTFPEKEVIAIFPEKPYNKNPELCMSYMKLGQHAAASIKVVQDTRASTPSEIEPLRKELENIGYKLKICKKISPKMTEIKMSKL